MKKTIFILFTLLVAGNVFSQSEPPAPYTKTLTTPQFTIRNVVDSSVFNNSNLPSKTNIIFIYFGPDCGHCTFFTKKMVDSISLFKNTHIVMVSSSDYSHIKKFYDDNKLSEIPFITVGRDADYFFITHFGVRQFPSAYVYNTNGKFVKSFVLEININELAEEPATMVKPEPKKSTKTTAKKVVKKRN